MCGALHELVPFVHLKNVKNNDGGVLLLVKPAWAKNLNS